MTQLTVDEIIRAFERLSSDDQRQVAVQVNHILGGSERAKQDEASRQLLERGIITASPPRNYDPDEYAKRELVEIEGEALSETVIEERDRWRSTS